VRGRRVGAAILVALLLSGCASTSLKPIGQAPFTHEEDERRLWARSEEEQRRLDASGLLYEDPALDAYLHAVLERLRPPDVGATVLPVRIRVLRHPFLNAFAFPNGALYVHTGILARLDNEAQLATLLAHELTHATHRHTVARFRDVQNKTAFMSTVGVMAMPFGLIGAVVLLFGAVGTVAAVYGYSQEQEAEADRVGLALVVRAGYDPREAPKIFAHLKQWVQDEKKPEPFFFGTHPKLEERTASYEALLKGEFREAAARGGTVGDTDFLTRTRALLLVNAELDLQAGRFLQARKGLTKYLALAPDDARAYYYVAETHRRGGEAKERVTALEQYAAALARDPTYADPYRGMGTLHYQAGEYASAREAFRTYLDLAPAAKDRPFIEEILGKLAKEAGGS
jgi:predicted Zn-dependent protease